MTDGEKPLQATTFVSRPARGWRYYLKRLMIDIVIGYVLICLGVFLFQKKLVYQPAKEATLTPQAYGFAPAQARALETQTSDGVTIQGWHVVAVRHGEEATLAKAAGVDLFFCGNAGNRSDRNPTFRRLTSLGVDVVCFDYRGYGDSDGSPDEEGLAKDARAAWDYVCGQGVPSSSIVIHGESLGGAVAVRLATELCAEGSSPAGLILEATFPRLRAVGAKHYPFLPVRLILTQTFPSVERITALTCPLLQLHGARDPIVPIALGQDLFAAAPAQSASGVAKEFVELPLCEHNDVGLLNAEEYNAAVGAFYRKLFPALERPREPHPVPEKTDRPARTRPRRSDRGPADAK